MSYLIYRRHQQTLSHGLHRVLPLSQGKPQETEGRKAKGAWSLLIGDMLASCQRVEKTCGENCNGSIFPFDKKYHGLVSFPLTLDLNGFRVWGFFISPKELLGHPLVIYF